MATLCHNERTYKLIIEHKRKMRGRGTKKIVVVTKMGIDDLLKLLNTLKQNDEESQMKQAMKESASESVDDKNSDETKGVENAEKAKCFEENKMMQKKQTEKMRKNKKGAPESVEVSKKSCKSGAARIKKDQKPKSDKENDTPQQRQAEKHLKATKAVQRSAEDVCEKVLKGGKVEAVGIEREDKACKGMKTNKKLAKELERERLKNEIKKQKAENKMWALVGAFVDEQRTKKQAETEEREKQLKK